MPQLYERRRCNSGQSERTPWRLAREWSDEACQGQHENRSGAKFGEEYVTPVTLLTPAKVLSRGVFEAIPSQRSRRARGPFASKTRRITAPAPRHLEAA